MARIGPWIVTVPDLRGTLFRTAVSIGLLAAACLGLSLIILKVKHDDYDNAPKVSVSTAFSTITVTGSTQYSTEFVTTTLSGPSALSPDVLTVPAFTAKSVQPTSPDPVTSPSHADQPGNYVLPTSTTANNTALTAADITITAAPPALYTGPLTTAAPMNATLVNSTGNMNMTFNNATMWKRANNWHLKTLHVSGGQGAITFSSLPQLTSLPTLQLHNRDAFDPIPTLSTTYDTLGTATLTLDSPDSEVTTKTGIVIEMSGSGFTEISVESATLAPATVTNAASKSRVVLVTLAIFVLFAI